MECLAKFWKVLTNFEALEKHGPLRPKNIMNSAFFGAASTLEAVPLTTANHRVREGTGPGELTGPDDKRKPNEFRTDPEPKAYKRNC